MYYRIGREDSSKVSEIPDLLLVRIVQLEEICHMEYLGPFGYSAVKEVEYHT